MAEFGRVGATVSALSECQETRCGGALGVPMPRGLDSQRVPESVQPGQPPTFVQRLVTRLMPGRAEEI